MCYQLEGTLEQDKHVGKSHYFMYFEVPIQLLLTPCRETIFLDDVKAKSHTEKYYIKISINLALVLYYINARIS